MAAEDFPDDPEGCIACGAIAGCCPDYPNCPGNKDWSPAKTVLEQLRMKLQGGPCWLIECGHPHVRYYGGEPGDWCDNPQHAHRYATKEAAEAVCSRMHTIDERRVVEHLWEKPE